MAASWMFFIAGRASTNDSIWALEGADILSGLAGDDQLFGQDGADQINGGDGNDVLDGGSGGDTLTGGTGADVFVFRPGDSGLSGGADRIVDFVSGLDRIDLTTVDADPSQIGDQPFRWIGNGNFSGVSGELRYSVIGADTWIQADTNGDGIVDFEITLTGMITPGPSDFLL